jgi:predicted nucleotidyltransferase
MRKPKDKDIIETVEGLLFSVVGYLHPPDYYTAYLKYRPDNEGRWERYGTRYRRMMGTYSAEEMVDSTKWLRQNYPDYVSRCQVRKIDLPLIPRKKVIRYYLPEVRLVELLSGPCDDLEKKTQQLVTKVAEVSGVSTSVFGITGSILTDMHNPSLSDINLIIFGANNAWKVHDTIKDIYSDNRFKPFSRKEIVEWQTRQTQILGIPKIYCKHLIWSGWRRGRISSTPYSLNAVRIDSEITEEYGKEIFSNLGTVEFTATVVNDRDCLFLPARYLVEEVKIHEGPADLPTIREIVSFEGVFAGAAHQGDRIRVRGTAEAVENKKEQVTHCQVVIGSLTSQGWLIPIESRD